MSRMLTGISSMATRELLNELAVGYELANQQAVRFDSVGGVDAAKRVVAGEAFDVVVLAANAIDKLVSSGHVRTGSKVDIVRSGVAIAVKSGSPVPTPDTEASLRAAVLAAASVGYSTGPSGVAVLELFKRWGIIDTLGDRLIQAQPGVPVGQLIAEGVVELGFQQLSELMHLPGIVVIGPMPPEIAIETIFSAAICASCNQTESAQRLLQYLGSDAAATARKNNGMSAV
ncbi:MAG: substrate-binding domain-containing protein [Burkholderiaceae bacterium]